MFKPLGSASGPGSSNSLHQTGSNNNIGPVASATTPCGNAGSCNASGSRHTLVPALASSLPTPAGLSSGNGNGGSNGRGVVKPMKLSLRLPSRELGVEVSPRGGRRSNSEDNHPAPRHVPSQVPPVAIATVAGGSSAQPSPREPAGNKGQGLLSSPRLPQGQSWPPGPHSPLHGQGSQQQLHAPTSPHGQGGATQGRGRSSGPQRESRQSSGSPSTRSHTDEVPPLFSTEENPQAPDASQRRPERRIVGTLIDRRFIEVGGKGRSRSLNTADAASITKDLAKMRPLSPPRQAGHKRNLSWSLSGENRAGVLSSSQGESWRSEKALKIAKDYVRYCLDLPVSREKAVTFEPGWASAHMPRDSIAELCIVAVEVLSMQPTLVQAAAPCKVFGDIHGQFSDLLLFFKLFGQPDHHTGDIEALEYVFLGDLIDRGRQGVEVVLFLFCLKVLYPERVWLIRGNHEDADINLRYGFHDECMMKYPNGDGQMVFNLISDVYSWMPLACLIEDRILCIHGGVGHVDEEVITLDAIARVRRPFTSVFEDTSGRIPKSDWKVIMSLLWGDPAADCGDGNHASLRTGVSKIPLENERQSYIRTFGPSTVKRFLARNAIDVVIRGHECVDQGFLFFAGGRLITVFSARNYAGTYRNDAAILLISKQRTRAAGGAFKLQITPKVLKAAQIEEPWPFYPQVRDVSPCRKVDDYCDIWGDDGKQWNITSPVGQQANGRGRAERDKANEDGERKLTFGELTEFFQQHISSRAVLA